MDCPPLPEPVYVDRNLWEQVILNLLSNALKFTFAGRIRVAVRGEPDGVCVTVSDTGIGVREAEIPRLFERFHRVENTAARSNEGSGIGLALVKELVGLHGGVITAESAEGRGTSFTIRLPYGAAHLPPEARSRPRSLPRSSALPPPIPSSRRRCAGCRARPGRGRHAGPASGRPPVEFRGADAYH